MCQYDWEAAEERPDDPFAQSGHTREEWLALTDEMIRRWTAYRAHLLTLLPPDGTAHG